MQHLLWCVMTARSWYMALSENWLAPCREESTSFLAKSSSCPLSSSSFSSSLPTLHDRNEDTNYYPDIGRGENREVKWPVAARCHLKTLSREVHDKGCE